MFFYGNRFWIYSRMMTGGSFVVFLIVLSVISSDKSSVVELSGSFVVFSVVSFVVFTSGVSFVEFSSADFSSSSMFDLLRLLTAV